jgi:predicted alpha/beta superfamily hydrolase
MGGLISHYVLFEYPSVFGRAGIFSPSYRISDEVFSHSQEKDHKKSLSFVILIEGKEFMTQVSNVMKMKDILHEAGYTDKQLKVIHDKNGKHNEAFWTAYFAEAVQFLFK